MLNIPVLRTPDVALHLDASIPWAPKPKVPYNEEGMEALVFTADGDVRQALNNLQATHSSFCFISKENVFRVCDQPHPKLVSGNGGWAVPGHILASGYCSGVLLYLPRVVRLFSGDDHHR